MRSRLVVACLLIASVASAQQPANCPLGGAVTAADATIWVCRGTSQSPVQVSLGGLLASKLALNLNQTNTDNAVTVSAAKYIIRRIVVTNASINMTANLATIGVFTGAGGTGTTVVALTLVQGLTGTTKFVDTTVVVTADALTAATLLIRNGVTAGTVATVDVYIFGDVLP